MSLAKIRTDEHEYLVRVFTGDEPGAGTDGTVMVSFIGKTGVVDFLELKNSENHKNKFERNQTDQFRLTLPNIGQIRTLKVALQGRKDDWYLDKILVDCPTLGSKYLFPCGHWFSAKKDGGVLERNLTPKVI